MRQFQLGLVCCGGSGRGVLRMTSALRPVEADGQADYRQAKLSIAKAAALGHPGAVAMLGVMHARSHAQTPGRASQPAPTPWAAGQRALRFARAFSKGLDTTKQRGGHQEGGAGPLGARSQASGARLNQALLCRRGDFLYVPEGYWHAVRSTGLRVCVHYMLSQGVAGGA